MPQSHIPDEISTDALARLMKSAKQEIESPDDQPISEHERITVKKCSDLLCELQEKLDHQIEVKVTTLMMLNLLIGWASENGHAAKEANDMDSYAFFCSIRDQFRLVHQSLRAIEVDHDDFTLPPED